MSTMENSDISSDPAALLEDQYQFLFWVLLSQFSLGLDLTCCEPCFVTRLHGDRPIKSGRRLGLRIRVWFFIIGRQHRRLRSFDHRFGLGSDVAGYSPSFVADQSEIGGIWSFV